MSINNYTKKSLKTGDKITEVYLSDIENTLADSTIQINTNTNDISTVKNLANNIKTEVETARGGKTDLNTRISKIENDLSTNTSNISTINSGLSDITQEQTTQNNSIALKVSKNDVIIKNIRQDNYKVFSKFSLPSGFNGTFKPVNIFTDGEGHYTTDFIASNYKNTGGVTYYVSSTGVPTNAGTSKDAPTTFSKALTNYIAEKDTIYMFAGNYFREGGLAYPITITKSINIIGEGTVNIICGDNLAYTLDSATGLYYASRSSTHRIIDINSEDFCLEYKKVTSIANCQAEKGTWYTDNVTIYVNPYDGVTPSNRLIPLVALSGGIVLQNSANMNIYFENLSIIGCKNNVLTNKSTSYSLTCTLNNVRGYYSQQTSGGNNFCFGGGNIICYKCKSMYSGKDGFNYNQYNTASESVACNFVEIDCVGASNGINDSSGAFNNGSTCHSGTHGIRINGTYYNNYGGNVADVQPNTQTINLGCKAFDSSSADSGTNVDFTAQQSGAEMWLYDCIGLGSVYNIYPITGSTMHLTNCIYETTQGSGTIDIIS